MKSETLHRKNSPPTLQAIVEGYKRLFGKVRTFKG